MFGRLLVAACLKNGQSKLLLKQAYKDRKNDEGRQARHEDEEIKALALLG